MAVYLRRYPYPYQAMLAICSDLDETPNQAIYFETARYLNTHQETFLGKGVGLEVGNTIYFDMPKGQFSYSNSDDVGRQKVQKLIESGHIDCLHSFGDLVNCRSRIEACWAELQQATRKVEVWVDHGQAQTNFDNDIMQGKGAIEGENAFHSDLTVQSGELAFIWKGRVTSLVAQNSVRCYQGLFNRTEIAKSCKTILTEFTKGWLGRLGSAKYAMHAKNSLLRKTKLIDGSPVWEFMRCNPSWAGVSTFEKARGIEQVLTCAVLDTLVKRSGCSVLYTHLGKVFSVQSPFREQTRRAFELLADYQKSRKILTATTRRLLGYARTVSELDYFVKEIGNETHIYLNSEYQGEDLHGLTWYVNDPEKVKLFINKQLFEGLQSNPPDHSKQASVSIPWTPLQFPFNDG